MYLAHVKRNDQGIWILHSLEEHLRGVSQLASKFASSFGSQDWAATAGLWHDLGKYRKQFQNYIKEATGYNEEAHIEQRPGRVDHSTAGALYACNHLGAHGRLIAYQIAGHHAGLPDWNHANAAGAALIQRLNAANGNGYFDQVLEATISEDILNIPEIHTIPLGGHQGLHLWVRMLFSCLVDADFLDTEKFMDPERASHRSNGHSIPDLKKKFDHYMSIKAKKSTRNFVNDCRASILNDCRNAGQNPSGIFTLTVPTGGGKTLSGMAFALEHAIAHNKKRIIVAIPYTSIIEQTAEQYRSIFGDAVLEHHSNLDPKDPGHEDSKSRLASENWDAPIIVTTNVQLFESIFAARPSRCRKLHNLANSIIIIDEAQLIPPDFLQPILDALRLLTEHYGVTLVLSTATQPALGTRHNNFGQEILCGLDNTSEIINDVEGLFSQLSRVNIRIPNLQQTVSWSDLAEEIQQHRKVLTIVNTRKDAKKLHQLMPEGTIHLSGQMCGEHRSKIIQQIKEKLQKDEDIRVISTQLVEAGVDLDFPVVYRALAGLDSIAQAAGRCNREGKIAEKGNVYVFVPPNPPPPGFLNFSAQAAVNVLHNHEGLELPLPLFNNYFQNYYAQINNDSENINDLLTGNAMHGQVQFREAAKRFRLISDTGQSILVPYGENGKNLLCQLKKQGPERNLLRKLQRYSVNIYEAEFNRLRELGAIEEIYQGIWNVCITNAYSEDLGLLSSDQITTIPPENTIF